MRPVLTTWAIRIGEYDRMRDRLERYAGPQPQLAMPRPDIRTNAGRSLYAWSLSDAQPLQLFGFDTVAEAIEAIERQARE